ncbi:serine hydrolase domain-containing protein [Sandaracinobacteroides hominis]|uniref:serine hydrolase domain-containing protein n=1 Tax=Sandaracinobacteroides hominis TaxID=2780086 RepID=UPI0018F79CB0|nr:serine hydrolase [Sandaracinobacteroides hominis]
MMRISLLFLLLLSVPAAAQRDPAWEAQYKQRFTELMKAGGIMTVYSPMEEVKGAAKPELIPMAKPGERSIRPEALEKAQAYAAANNSSAFLVWRDGKLQAAWFPAGSDVHSQLVSKSLSKPVSAIAIGRAIQLGKIRSPDQPVADFVPEWKGTPKEAILVRHLLDMRSGLMPQGFSDDPDHPMNRAYIDPDHGQQIVDNYPLTQPPGSEYGYNNATAELVALVIERATGRRYAEFIGTEILQPLGAEGGKIWVNREGGLAHSGCCMTMPAENWLKLAILLLDDGVWNGKRLLPEGFVKDMRTPTPQNPHFGMGLWLGEGYAERRSFGGPKFPGGVLHSQPFADGQMFLFDGNHNQVVYISPQTRTVILRTGNNPPKQPEWDNSVLPNTVIGGIIPKKGEKPPVPQAKP